MSFPRGKKLVIVQTTNIYDFFSAAGKILRRELRDRAKKELAGRDPHDDYVNAKL
jgi:hypothetical protein